MGRRKWNPTITLPQLRSLVEMMNNMLLIPAKNKEFIMGKATGKGYDSPQHTVILSSDYYICKYEVTRSLWYAVMNDSIVTEEGTLPMTHITWNDAEAFTKKLNKLTGLPFSLPTGAMGICSSRRRSYPYAGSGNIRDVTASMLMNCIPLARNTKTGSTYTTYQATPLR